MQVKPLEYLDSGQPNDVKDFLEKVYHQKIYLKWTICLYKVFILLKQLRNKQKKQAIKTLKRSKPSQQINVGCCDAPIVAMQV